MTSPASLFLQRIGPQTHIKSSSSNSTADNHTFIIYLHVTSETSKNEGPHKRHFDFKTKPEIFSYKAKNRMMTPLVSKSIDRIVYQ